MKSFGKLTYVNLKLSMREPMAMFFTLAFPPLLVVLFGAMYGNDPAEMFGGYGSMDISMPAYTALILSTVGLMSVPITISGYRETGVLRRFQATALRPLTYIAADVVAHLAMTLLGMVGLVVAGWLLYRVQFEGNAIAVACAVVLGGLCMFSVGYLIASLAPNKLIGGDLKHEIDFRSVYATLLDRWLGCPREKVFGAKFDHVAMLK